MKKRPNNSPIVTHSHLLYKHRKLTSGKIQRYMLMLATFGEQDWWESLEKDVNVCLLHLIFSNYSYIIMFIKWKQKLNSWQKACGTDTNDGGVQGLLRCEWKHAQCDNDFFCNVWSSIKAIGKSLGLYEFVVKC